MGSGINLPNITGAPGSMPSGMPPVPMTGTNPYGAGPTGPMTTAPGGGPSGVMTPAPGTGPTGIMTGGPGNVGYGNSGNPNPTITAGNPYLLGTTSAGSSGMSTLEGSSVPGAAAPGAGPIDPATGLPVSPSAGLPGTSMNPGGGPGTGNANGLDPRQSDRTLAELQKYYGEGMGSMLFNFLQSGGGFNSALTSQAVQAQNAAMQHQIQEGEQNLWAGMGNTGVSPNSSVWALETGDYMSNAVAQENAITAQEYFNMWNQSQNRMTDILGKVSDVNATGTANEAGLMSWLTGATTAFGSPSPMGGGGGGGASGGGGMSEMMMMLMMGA